MRPIVKGSTDQSVVIRIVDATDGTPETGVVYNASGIDLWYRREGAVKTSITEAALSALSDAHADGGVLHIGDGYYRLDLPDAAVATGANGVAVGGTVTGMVVIGCYAPLVDFNPYDAVRAGLTAIPNVAAGAAGGVPLSADASGRVDVLKVNGTNQTARDLGASVLLSVGTGAGQVNVSGGKVPATLGAGDIGANAITAAAIATGAIDADAIADGAIDNGAFADGAITAAKIGTGAITNAKFAAGAIDAAVIATDAIDADALKADAVTEIQSGLATTTQLNAVEADTQDIQTRLPAALASGRMVADAVAISGSTAAADGVEANIGNLDAPVSTRLATADYTPPMDVSADVAATRAVTDKLDTALVLDGVVYQFTANALENAPSGGGGSAPTTAEIADKILGRNLAGGSDGGRTVRDALRPARNKVAFDVPSAGQFTVFAEDDSTPAWVGGYTRTAGADPLTAVDPA